VAALCALKCADELSAVTGLAIATAAVWLMNAPAGVMLMYTLALLLVVLAIADRSIRPVIHGTAGIALGIGLASFYIVPAAYEQSWVNIVGIFGSGLAPRENFLFSVATDPPHTYFNFLVSGIALEQFALLAFVLLVVWKARHRKEPGLQWLPALTVIGL